MSRPQEPKSVIEWKEKVRNFHQFKTPQCCHTCDNYNEAGTCTLYYMEPPEDFAGTLNQCNEWEEIIPF